METEMDTAVARTARQVAEAALSWLDGMRGSFALPTDTPDDHVLGDALKALAELTLATALVRREAIAGPRSADLADRLLDFCWQQVGQGELLYRLQARTPAATYPMEIYAPFAAAGYRHERLDRLAAQLYGLRAYRVVEHVPNRRLALVSAAAKIGVAVPDDLAALTGQTWLGGTPEPWMLDPSNAYGVTHTVFHLTDWGARPEGLPPQLQDYLHQWLPAWAEVYCETRLWDLLLEMLMVGTCLGRPLFSRAIWEQVAAAQRADGMMPNGMTKPPADPHRAWRNHHHPTIVAVAAGTLTLSRAVSHAATGARSKT
ncbi:DUF6895 family protein [Nonomuraea longicatena]|uniref:DUF6895 domain-containing protein n=1 Tax=Nonomuraea longicatena TaxID=83682 RepID=A0ABN1NW21_9ACTN